MTQKDKVKELVGRGLHSYHTKSLQQMDRIEKKNKQQNHKISMLTNELDNDYITKTEEVSVVSLEHSKEGMVYLDKLQGNTLVNYCTDSSKELTLNGDIDLEGTFVTTTEGVDGGKVYVLCEGNTLILDENGNEVEAGSEGARLVSVGQDDENGHKIEILSQNKNLYKESEFLSPSLPKETINNKEYYVLKGVNTPTINNLLIDDTMFKFKENTQYTFTIKGMRLHYFHFFYVTYTDGTKSSVKYYNAEETEMTFTTLANKTIKNVFTDTGYAGAKSYILVNGICMKEGIDTTFISQKSNKKEISLIEPLRSLPNGKKDRFIEIGGEWFIERNVGQSDLIITGGSKWGSGVAEGMIGFYGILSTTNLNYNGTAFEVEGNIVCDKLNSCIRSKLSTETKNSIIRGDNYVGVVVKRSDLETEDLEGVKKYINSLNAKFIYNLATPVYEPLEIEPILNCYNDTTHISNNSIIPCNMKIKNSGYNAIIKPSTLYTVALDTNKSGTIGMNLGGAKGTTTNNVLTLTTPATLTDNSLRIYGKGIKGSKVRLLEGDKTNWIPSFFEGMQSSFEDKFDTTDNTYKMEILSNNENLLDLTQHSIGTPYTNHYVIKNNSIIGIYEGDNYTDFQIWFNLKRNRTYKLSYSQESTYELSGNNSQLLIGKRSSYSGDCVLHQCYNGSAGIITNVPYDGWYTLHFHSLKNNNTIKDLQLKESNLPTDFVERKYNKIQFSSIEPLRSVDNTKDKFVFKDNKLMIERNCGAFKINSSQGFIRASKYDNGYLYGFEKDFDEIKRTFQSNKIIKCDKLPYYPYSGGNIAMKNINGEWIGTWSNETTRSVIMLRLKTKDNTLNSLNEYLKENPIEIIYIKTEPTYEEIPFELQKIILEGYENGTLFFDTNIPPTSTITYAGETPIVKSVRLNKTEVLNNTNDINDNIIPYLMDMDYRVVCLELATETQGISMARLFGGVYEMLKRDILSRRLTREEYGHRLADYYNAGKLTEEQVRELEDLR